MRLPPHPHGPRRQQRPLDIGRSSRTIPWQIRKALVARDQGCALCGAHPRNCDGHHIRMWVKDGKTKLWNLVLLCRRCHRLMHRKTDPYQVRIDPRTGHPVFTHPNGQQFHPPNRPPPPSNHPPNRPDDTGLFA